MIAKRTIDTTARPVKNERAGGIAVYMRRVFAMMFGAVLLTGAAAFVTMASPALLTSLIGQGGLTPLYYILMFGGLGISIWAQARAFHMRPAAGGALLALYAILMGMVMTPLLLVALWNNPFTIVMAFGIAAAMFACMAMFGYKTSKNLSFLGLFLFMGMIGLILVGIASFIWPMLMGGTFGTIVCFIGVLVFALFTAYDMQNLKYAYSQMGGDETQKNQLAVLGALHLYISFVAMFQYVLSLLNRD